MDQHIRIISAYGLGELRTIFRSRFIRFTTLALIAIAFFLDYHGGTHIFATTCLSTTALLPIHLQLKQRRDQLVEEQIWSTPIDRTTETVGTMLAYALGTIIMLGLCWIAFFPFSSGQGGGIRVAEGTLWEVTTRASFPLLLKTFLVTQMMTGLTLLLRPNRLLAWPLVIGYWLSSLFVNDLITSYGNMYVLEQGHYPPIFYITSFAPLAVNSLFALPSWPWILPSLGFALFSISLVVLWQKRPGTILLSRSITWKSLAVLGLAVFVAGQILFVQFLKSIYLHDF